MASASRVLRRAVEKGVLSGGGRFQPKGLAARAHAAQMLKNFLENG